MDKVTENPKQSQDPHKNQILVPLPEVGTPLQVGKQPDNKKVRSLSC